jgi:hypothetical protein
LDRLLLLWGTVATAVMAELFRFEYNMKMAVFLADSLDAEVNVLSVARVRTLVKIFCPTSFCEVGKTFEYCFSGTHMVTGLHLAIENWRLKLVVLVQENLSDVFPLI